jgi:cupin 2 domain-containing protein
MSELPPGVRSGRLNEGRFPSPAEGEWFDTLLSGSGFRIERILSAGHVTAPGEWYDQAGDEWVLLVEGSATIAFATGARCMLKPGDWLYLPGRCKHRVERTSQQPECVWLAVHADPRTVNLTPPL